METVAKTRAGAHRDHNEDAVLCQALDPNGDYLLAVADGMGGHHAGDVASQTATRELREAVLRALRNDRTNLRAILADAFVNANRKVRSFAAPGDGASMGTTLVAAIVGDGTAVVGNVGDSRAYLVGDGVEQLTRDHSLVQGLVDAGTITAAEAESHPQRNVLTQAMGTEEDIVPDFFEVDLEDGVLLLSSDGLTGAVGDDAIEEIVTKAATLESAGEQLIERAVENGGTDDVSVVLGASDGG